MSVSEAYQDDHVPKGSEAEPLAELAYGLQVPVTTINLFIPCGVSRRRQNGGIGLKCAALKVLGLFRDGGYVIAFKLSQYVFDAWNDTPL